MKPFYSFLVAASLFFGRGDCGLISCALSGNDCPIIENNILNGDGFGPGFCAVGYEKCGCRGWELKMNDGYEQELGGIRN